MQIVIDIDEEILNKLPEAELGSNVIEDVLEGVENGIPLGDVLDKLKNEIIQVANQEKLYDERWALGLKYAVKIINKYRPEKDEDT